MAGIGLVLSGGGARGIAHPGHICQVLHGQKVLCPILEDRPISSIGDQFMRMLGNAGVQIILDH